MSQAVEARDASWQYDESQIVQRRVCPINGLYDVQVDTSQGLEHVPPWQQHASTVSTAKLQIPELAASYCSLWACGAHPPCFTCGHLLV